MGGAVPALVFALGSTAMAQDISEGAADADLIVITGIQQAIAKSLELKRESNSIVEAISAEDIGKLPDVSIADSLARLPGVTAQRVRGRAQQISIRGLGPDFSIALLNGREVVSAGNNRGIEFDQFPSELIAQGVVYKTPDARLSATGIAGAVDLRTVKPLDYTERQLNVSGKYVINDNGKLNPDFGADGYRLFGSYIDQFADNRIGVAIGITDQSNPTQFFSRELKTSPGQTEDFGGVRIPRDNPRSGVVSRSFDRTSVAGTLQFEPTENFQLTGDVFYSDSEDAGIFRGVETPIASWSGVTASNVTGTGFADSVTYAPVVPILRTDTEGNEAETLSFGINGSYSPVENLKFTVDYSESSLERTDIDYESYAGTGRGIIGNADVNLTDELTYTLPESGEYSIATRGNLDYTDPSTVLLTDPGGWGQVGFLRTPDVEDDLDQIRLEAEYEVDVPVVKSIVAGYLNTDRRKAFTDNAFFLRPGNGFVDSSLAIPTSTIVGSTDPGSIGLDIIAYDPSEFLTNGTYVVEGTNATAWVVNEDIDTYYGMLNLETDLGSVPVRGNVGFQYVETNQASTGTLGTLTGAQQEQTVSESYNDFLPSVNLSFEVMNDTFLRGSFAKTLTRPRLDQLAANQDVSFNSLVCIDSDLDQVPDTFNAGAFNPPQNVCLNFDGGNPFLQPYRSTSFDLAVERYFGDAGALSLAVFTKDLSDYVQDGTTAVNAPALAAAQLAGSPIAGNANVDVIGISGPNNLENGSLTGFEVALRLGLDDILPIKGFGLNASYSYTDSQIDGPNGNPIDIPGYSSTVASGELYYENYGWRARVNGRYRGGFLSEVLQFDGTLTGERALSEFIIDAQLGYEWDEGALEGFSVNVEAYNLTDEPFRTENEFNGNGDTFVSRREDYGRTFNFTVAKKF